MSTISTEPAPTLTDDPFGPEVLDDPLPFHERLREAGRVVHLPQYDLFAMGRYADVHAGLTDWQTFQSAAGVGLSNFRKEEPWRPPSLLLEADPPHHDAPRHALEEILNPRRLRHLRDQWLADAETLVDEILGARGVRRCPRHRRRLPAARLPRCRRTPPGGTRAPAPLRRPPLQLLRSAELPGPERTAPHRRDVGLDQGAVHARGARRARVRGRHLGRGRPRRHHRREAPLIVRSVLTAGVDTTVHGSARSSTPSSSTPTSGSAYGRTPARPRRVRRGDPAGVAGADVLPHHDARRGRRWRRHPRRPQGPAGPRLGEP